MPREVERPRRRARRARRGTDRARAGSAPCSGSGGRAEKRASKSSGGELDVAHDDRRPAQLVDRALQRGEVERLGRSVVSKLTTWPQACTPASVRPAHVELDRVAQHPLERRRQRARRRCTTPGFGRSRGSRCRRRRRRASGRDPTAADGRRSRSCSDQFDARHRRVVAVARAELEDAGVATRCGRRSAGRSRRTAWRHLLVAEVRDDLAVVVQAALLGLGDDLLGDGRRALALASVVTMPSAAISDATRLAIIAFWWAASPPKRRPFFGVAAWRPLTP